MASISFLQPIYLLFLFLIPFFIFIHLATLKATKTTSLRFANFEAIAKIKGVDFFSKNIIILSLSILIVFLLVMGLSGAVLNIIIEASDHSFVIALDSSKSMEADDIAPNRMEAAKSAAADFVESVPITTKVGIISFSGNAFIEQDLTDSKSLMKTAISEIEAGNIGGTDIFEAVVTGTNLLKGEKSKAIILLSDGQINVGDITQVIEYASNNGVIIHTIAIGTGEGGQTSYGLSKLDEDTLMSLSHNTNGEFFSAIDESELNDSFNNAIKKTRRSVGINLSSYLFITAILLFSLEYILVNGRYRRLV